MLESYRNIFLNTITIMERKIIHVDLDAFFCAVEEQANPSLRGKPFAVGGKPDERGVVSSCSYAARKFGVRSAMPSARALRLCPDLTLIHANHQDYGKVSRKIFKRLSEITEQIEQISIDEAFFDVTDSTSAPVDIAKGIQRIIRDEFGLPSSLGVATNKLMAKIATDVGKSSHSSDTPPNAITVVTPGEEMDFLEPLPVEVLWGVGPKTAAKLESLGIYTIGELARWPPDDLVKRFGKYGDMLHRHALGIDNNPISTVHVVKSISRETTFAKDIQDTQVINKTIKSLSENIAKRLIRSNQCGSTVKLKLRWADFTTLTRQVTLSNPITDPNEINSLALKLLEANWDRRQPIRLIGIGVCNLSSSIAQMSFFNTLHEPMENREEPDDLEKVISQLIDKFGPGIIFKGKPSRNDNH